MLNIQGSQDWSRMIEFLGIDMQGRVVLLALLGSYSMGVFCAHLLSFDKFQQLGPHLLPTNLNKA